MRGERWTRRRGEVEEKDELEGKEKDELEGEEKDKFQSLSTSLIYCCNNIKKCRLIYFENLKLKTENWNNWNYIRLWKIQKKIL